MLNFVDLAIAFMIAFIASFLLTYPVKKFAMKIGR